MAVNSTFDIQINYSGDSQYLGVFQAAADRWEQIIIADIPDINSGTYGFVDDLLIDASVVAIDGSGGVLAQAGPDWVRSSSYLPFHGIMQFDSADVAVMFSNGTLATVVLHEMGHVLGIGTLWDAGPNNLLDPVNHRYTGANALAEYRILTGNPSASYVPVEDGGGPGTANGHWDEEIFNTEIMTGYIESAGTFMPISRMTIASLADLGYVVNMSAADPYSMPGGGGANRAPSITSNGAGTAAAISLPENTAAVTTVTASDPDGNALTYSIVGGTDQQRFQINSATGALRFVTAPNFEAPTDSDGNNSYVVQVRVSDGSLTDTQTITVTVTNVAPIIVGTNADNVLTGTSEEDTIQGLGANDTLTGLGGNDILDGGSGTDTAVFTNRAEFYTIGQAGNNIMVTGEGTDTVFDNVERFQFADVTFTRAELLTEITPPVFTVNADTVVLSHFGGTFNALGGNDALSYRGGFVTIDGGAGSDTLDFSAYGSAVWVSFSYNGPEIWTRDRPNLAGGTWRAIGEISNVENLIGSAFDDLLRGSGSDNTIVYTGGLDTVDGMAGTDTVDFSRFGSAVWVDFAYNGREAWTRDNAAVTSGTWREIADLTGIETVIGTDFADDLRGDANANRLVGGDGTDLLNGRAGNDILDGGNGTDTAVFTHAINSYTAALAGSDIVVTGEGTDTVHDNVELFQFADVTLTRAQLVAEITPPAFTGNADTVALSRFGGTVNALGGDDVLSYQGGFVTIDGGTGSDTLDFSAFGSAVWVSFSFHAAEGWTMDRPNLTGGTWRSIAEVNNVENLAGSLFDDFLQGNGSDNIFFYTGGLDTVEGMGGSDTIDFSRFGAAVWVDLAYNGREAWTRDGVDVVSGTWRAIADLSGIAAVVGTSHADDLRGNADINRLDGGAGNDTLTGRDGNDLFVFRTGMGQDTITDFAGNGAAAGDAIQISLGAAFDTFAEVQTAASQQGSNVVINFGGGNTVTLQNVSLASLHQNDFLVV